MLKNYFKTTLRTLSKHKVFTLINVIGLSISMVACLLIVKYVEYGRSYDKFNQDEGQLYRVYRIAKGESPDDGVASVFPGMTPVMKKEIPEFDQVGRLIGSDKIFQSFGFTSYENEDVKTFNIERPFFADDDLLRIFTFDWKEGADVASLEAPYQVVISSTIAQKFFGDASAVGKVLHFKNMEVDYQITGVFEDWPENSHVQFDMLCSMSSLPKEWEIDTNFGWGNFYTYTKITKSLELSELEDKLNAALADKETWYKTEGVTFKLQNISDIHLTSHHSFELQANGNANTLTFLSIIGVFIMVIAWVNYINLSTTKLIDRAKEVGIRKVMGSQRIQLVLQFLLESVLINLLALIISLTVLQLTGSFFQELLGIPLDFYGPQSLMGTVFMLTVFMAGAILFGLYPAVLFSRQKISSVMNGRSKIDKRGLLLRKVLSTFQYVIAAILLFGTVSISNQLKFMQSQSLGMDIDQIMIIKKPFIQEADRFSSRSSFINRLNQMPSIKEVSTSSEVPGNTITRMRWVALGPGENDKALYAKDIAVDTAFMNLYDIEVLHGRSFSPDFNDRNSLMLSLSAAEDLLETDLESWIGKTIYYETEPYQLVGIVDDISQESLKNKAQPHIYTAHERIRFFSVKLSTDDLSNTIAAIGDVFNDSFATSHYDYFFLDTYFNRQYSADRLFGNIFQFFSILAIVITVLGLFGLSLYNIVQRSKEISIRKVLGAKVFQLFRLLTREYITLLSLSLLIALPLGTLLLKEWLSGFASQMSLDVDLYLIPVVLLVILTLVTVCYQVLKVAYENPVNALRNE